MTHFISAIILLGGSGTRFGEKIPKQFARLAGKAVYEHTLDLFIGSALFNEVIVVCHREWPIPAREGVRVITGGESRQESSYLGLQACHKACDIVVIHDGVRPFITKELLEENIELATLYGAVDTCIPSADTIVHTLLGDTITSIPARSEFVRGQTPQSFSYKVITHAHACAQDREATDDCSLVLAQNHPVHIAHGSEYNIKITSPLDLYLAEHIFRLRQSGLPKAVTTVCGKTYAVVGGHGGIGEGICLLLEQHGATAIPLSRQNGFDARYDTFPITDELDGLICTAGYLKRGDVMELSLDDIAAHIDTNLTSVIRCCKEAQIVKGGHIITLASSAYSRGRAGYAAYSAAKAGVVNFTQALAEEREDLCINCVIPGRTDTAMRRENFRDSEPLLDASDVAECVMSMLCGDVTGTQVEVKKSTWSCNQVLMRLDGLEPSTLSLKGRCSTN